MLISLDEPVVFLLARLSYVLLDFSYSYRAFEKVKRNLSLSFSHRGILLVRGKKERERENSFHLSLFLSPPTMGAFRWVLSIVFSFLARRHAHTHTHTQTRAYRRKHSRELERKHGADS